MATRDIMKIKDEVLERLADVALEKVILFGSVARGEENGESDIDLYVVTKDTLTSGTWAEKNYVYLTVSRKLRDLRAKYPLDLIVHSKNMHQKFVEMHSSMAREIMQHGVVLYG